MPTRTTAGRWLAAKDVWPGWGTYFGRLSEGETRMIDRYALPEMAAIWSQRARFEKWLEVEIAVCEAWAEEGVVPPSALEKIRRATFDLKKIDEYEAVTQHDVTAFLRSVADSLGEEARYVHLGLTSSDVIDTGLSLQIKEAAAILYYKLERLLGIVESLALQYKYTPIVGRTHGVHAEPTTFGLKLAMWLDELRRGRRRLDEAADQMAVGKISGAVGTHSTVPPTIEERVCARLGLKVAPVSTQIIQRDRHAQFLTTLALIGCSLDKMATEIRTLQRTEILEVEEPFGRGQQGSSAMPHKRNPIRSERISGLARVLRGNALTAMENVALWNERDISHSSAERVIFPESCLLLDYMLNLFANVLSGLQVYPDRMEANLHLTKGLVFSQRVLLALIDKGVSRQEAYSSVQRAAMATWRGEGDFLSLLKAEPAVMQHLSESELGGLFDYGYYLRYVDSSFARLGLSESAKKEGV